MEIGSLADWFSAIGGVLAVVAAVVAWRVSAHALELERVREERAAACRHREQAELVYAIGALLPERDKGERWAVLMCNSSDKPIYNVVINTVPKNGEERRPVQLGALPPGKYVIPSTNTSFQWENLHDYSLFTERVEFTKGKGANVVSTVEFQDAHRVTWVFELSSEGSRLREIPRSSEQAPLESD